jgi:uncharacterized protein YbjT (DUF2867 family)
MSESYIFVAGASRGVGREIVKELLNHHQPVKALLRSNNTQDELEGVKVVLGDALNMDELKRDMLDGDVISAMISTIGGLPKDGERADYLGNRNLIDIAVTIGVKHFILITSIGSGESIVALPPQVLEVLGPVLKEKEKAEKHLINSGLNYTIIRPGGLKTAPATNRGLLTTDYHVSGTIHRADVAKLAYKCLISLAARGKILSAVDRDMMTPSVGIQEFLDSRDS